MSPSAISGTNKVISFAAVIVIIYGLQMAKALLVPFLVAVFLALITVRPMLWMQSKRVPGILAALSIVSAIMLFLRSWRQSSERRLRIYRGAAFLSGTARRHY